MIIFMLLVASLVLSPITQEVTPESEPVCKSQIAMFTYDDKGLRSNYYGDYYLIDPETWMVKRILSNYEGNGDILAWSPNGTGLLVNIVTEDKYGLYVYHPADNQFFQLDKIIGYQAQWSPDGSYIIYARGGTNDSTWWGRLSLKTFKVDIYVTGYPADVMWAQRGMLLYHLIPYNPSYFDGYSAIGEYPSGDLRSTSATQLEIPDLPREIYGIHPSPNGQKLWIRMDNGFVYVFDLQEEKSQFISKDLHWGSWLWLPDSSGFVYYSDLEAYIYKLDGEVIHLPIAEAVGKDFLIEDISPDGAFLIIKTSHRITRGYAAQDLYVMNMDGTRVKHLWHNKRPIRAAWSPCIESSK